MKQQVRDCLVALILFLSQKALFVYFEGASNLVSERLYEFHSVKDVHGPPQL
jgi:hypothetical protein